jgi:hypothetical protein
MKIQILYAIIGIAWVLPVACTKPNTSKHLNNEIVVNETVYNIVQVLPTNINAGCPNTLGGIKIIALNNVAGDSLYLYANKIGINDSTYTPYNYTERLCRFDMQGQIKRNGQATVLWSKNEGQFSVKNGSFNMANCKFVNPATSQILTIQGQGKL